MLPNFFVIGAPKCGTSSLHVYLAAHPEIHMSPIKEPHFFAEPNARTGRPPSEKRVHDRDRYERLFESASAIRGESSPSYSQYPMLSGVPERIRELVPEASFIYVVGDPIRRVTSQYMQRVAHEGERRPFREALGDITEPANPIVCPSRYATQLERYRRVFSPDRLLVIDQSELWTARVRTLRKIFAFLGADPNFSSPIFKETANPSSGHEQIPSIYLAARKTRVGQWLSRRLPAGFRHGVMGPVRSHFSPNVERPSVDGQIRAELERELGGEIRRLRLLTGKPFSSWSL